MRRIVPMLALLVALPLLQQGAPADSAHWHYAGEAGQVRKKRVDEASGLVSSRTMKGVLWTHNDQPGDERVFALNPQGRLLGQLELRVDAHDWEDIALGPCAVEGKHCLYVADTGDSERERNLVQILRFEEPAFPIDADTRFERRIEYVEIAHFSYADGKSRDAEALVVDASGEVWLLDKNERATSLFRAGFERGLKPGARLTRVAVRDDLHEVTGADLAPDGRTLVVRNQKNAYEFDTTGQGLRAGFLGVYERLRLHHERQGEAIAYGTDADVLYTLSEGKREPIHRYERSALRR